jgi:hypothetical protein
MGTGTPIEVADLLHQEGVLWLIGGLLPSSRLLLHSFNLGGCG